MCSDIDLIQLGEFELYYNLFIDFLLILGFPILHSLPASFKSKKVISYLFNQHIYRLYYSLTAAIYLLVAGWMWRDVPIEVYTIPKPWSYLVITCGILGWFTYAYSHLMYYDVGSVFGTSQLISKYSNTSPPRFEFSTNGLKSFVRFPVHTAFILMFWGVNTMNFSTLLFSILGSIYAWLGTFHHDYRYTKQFGDSYIEYKKSTGMVFPIFKKYRTIIYDSTPRRENIPTIIILSLLTAPIWFLLAKEYLFIKNNIYLFVPLLSCLILFICGLIIVLFNTNYRYGCYSKKNRTITEKLSFTIGSISLIWVSGLYLTIYFRTGVMLSLIPSLSVWILGQISGNFGCLFINKLLTKNTHNKEVVL